MATDTSDYAVGTVHEQWVGGTWKPLALFSRQLCPREQKYSTFDWELPGLYLGHSQGAMAKVAQLSYIPIFSEFTTDIQLVVGKTNIVADSLPGCSTWGWTTRKC